MGPNEKVQQHDKDTLTAIQILSDKILLRKQYTRRGGNKEKVLLASFKEWNIALAPAKKSSRVIEKLTKLKIEHNVPYYPGLKAQNKCSGYRYLMYKFPSDPKL